MSLAQRFMDVLLPRGGCVMAFAEMYFDESEDVRHNLLCVAGYLFKKEKAVALEQKWASILAEAGLTHFHMVEAAHYKKGMFKGWEKPIRVSDDRNRPYRYSFYGVVTHRKIGP